MFLDVISHLWCDTTVIFLCRYLDIHPVKEWIWFCDFIYGISIQFWFVLFWLTLNFDSLLSLSSSLCCGLKSCGERNGPAVNRTQGSSLQMRRFTTRLRAHTKPFDFFCETILGFLFHKSRDWKSLAIQNLHFEYMSVNNLFEIVSSQTCYININYISQ